MATKGRPRPSKGERQQVWLYEAALAKLDRLRATLQLEHGGAVLSRPDAIEWLLDQAAAPAAPEGDKTP